MLKPGKTFRTLSILISPDGEFYTPTYDGYSLDEAKPKVMAALLSGKKAYLFQKVSPVFERFLIFFGRQTWEATRDTVAFDSFPKGWKILKGRPYQTPEKIDPEEAKRLGCPSS